MRWNVAMRTLLAAALVVATSTAAAGQEEGPTPEGTEWHLVAYDAGGPELTEVPWDLGATLTLDDGGVLGFAGCQGFAGDYVIDGKALNFSRVGPHTEVGCPEEPSAIEAVYLATLAKTARWNIGSGPAPGGDLLLFDAGDEHLLQFSSSGAALLWGQVRELTDRLEAQQKLIKALRARIKELEQATWGPLAVIDDAAEGGLDAAGGNGRLVINERCVFLRTAAGHRTTIIWRSGQTMWNPNRGQIVFRDSDLGEIRLSHRDRIEIGGAALGEGPYDAPAWLAEPDVSCPTSAWVVNQIDFVDK